MHQRNLAVLISILLCTPSMAAPPVTVADIRQAMEQYQQTLHSLNVEYVVRASPDWHFKNLENQPEYRWNWIVSGRKKLLTQEPALIPGTKTISRLWESFDGTNGYAVSYHAGDPTLVRRVDILPTEPGQLIIRQGLASALGWAPLNPKSPDTVLSLLRKTNVTKIEEELLDGISCSKVSLGEVGTFVDGGPRHEAIAWFSPSHGLLPRRIAVLPIVSLEGNNTKHVELPAGSFPMFVDILEFKEFDDTLFKQKRWFPHRVQTRALFSHEVSVKSVSLNQPVPATTFVPEMPPGTEVVTLASGSSTSKTEYVGGVEGERLNNQRLQQSGEQTKPLPAPVSSAHFTPVNASPRQGSYFSYWILAGSLLLIIVAYVVTKRQGR